MTKEPFTQLYQRHQEQINDVHRRCEENCPKEGQAMRGPYLIEPNDAYLNAAVKVVFVGQESGDWKTSECEIEKQLACYRDFNLNGRADGPVHPGAFWNVIRKLEAELIGTSHACAALNLNRFSQHGRSPSGQNQRILSELDFLLLEELKLLQPDIVIFFTGPRYDPRLNALLQVSHSAVEGFTTRQLSKIHSAELSAKIYRTYHPTYLRRRRLESKVIAAIKAGVKGPHTFNGHGTGNPS